MKILTLLFSLVVFIETTHAFPEIIDFGKRNHSTVQHIEISPVVVPYYGDVLETSLLYGSRFNYHFNHVWSLGGTFLYGKSVYDDRFPAITGRDSDTQLIYDSHVMYSLPAAFRLSDTIPVESDMYMLFGGGEEYLGGDRHIAFLVGGGLKMYTGIPWFAVRIGIRDYFYKLTVGGESKIVDDLVMMIGVSILLL